jgi:hypothetical protein
VLILILGVLLGVIVGVTLGVIYGVALILIVGVIDGVGAGGHKFPSNEYDPESDAYVTDVAQNDPETP